MSGWDAAEGSGWNADPTSAWDSNGGNGGFVADGGNSGASFDAGAPNHLGGEDAFAGGEAAGEDTCRNCGQTGHFARDCDQPRKSSGGCFRCGQEGHQKADCTNEPIDRPFTGTCRVCSQEGHPAAACPSAVCRLCSKAGHKAIDCKEKRGVDYGDDVEDLTAEAAWTKMKEADKAKDKDRFSKAFMAYAKATTREGGPGSVDLVDVEKTLRDENMNAHLVAQDKPISLDYTIVDFQGNADKTYALEIQWALKSRRAAFAAIVSQSAEENLERLADCGLMVDRGIPVCSNCKELGHTRKHCTQEPQTSGKEAFLCPNCGESHRMRDCKQERVEKHGISCRRCGNQGHKAVDCPEPDSRPPRTCRNCGKEDHMAKDCTEPRNPATVTCRNCDEVGHFSKECPKPRDWSRVQCSQCQEFGHTIARCKAGGEDKDAGADQGGWGETPAVDNNSGGGWQDATAVTAGGW